MSDDGNVCRVGRSRDHSPNRFGTDSRTLAISYSKYFGEIRDEPDRARIRTVEEIYGGTLTPLLEHWSSRKIGRVVVDLSRAKELTDLCKKR